MCDGWGMMQGVLHVEVVPLGRGPLPTKVQVESIVGGWKGERLQKVLAGHEQVRPRPRPPTAQHSAAQHANSSDGMCDTQVKLTWSCQQKEWIATMSRTILSR